MLALPQSDLPQFGYLFDQHLGRRYRRHLYACDDVCGDVYVCGGSQLGRENVDLSSIPLLELILDVHCSSLPRLCMVLPHLAGVLVICYLYKVGQALLFCSLLPLVHWNHCNLVMV